MFKNIKNIACVTIVALGTFFITNNIFGAAQESFACVQAKNWDMFNVNRHDLYFHLDPLRETLGDFKQRIADAIGCSVESIVIESIKSMQSQVVHCASAGDDARTLFSLGVQSLGNFSGGMSIYWAQH